MTDRLADDLAPAFADPRRHDVLRDAGLHAPGAEPGFDRLARVASRLLDVPVSFVSVLDEGRQLLKGTAGFPAPPDGGWVLPAADSFCRYVVAGDAPLVVEDARLHPELRHAPSVRTLQVRAYAGFPLRAPGGEVLGAFCAVDTRPRAWSGEALGLLADLTAAAATEVALRLELAERRRAQDDAARCHAEFETLAEHMPDVVVRVGRDGRRLYANGEAKRATELPAGADPHAGTPADRARWERALAEVFATGRPREAVFEVEGAAGPRWYDTRLIPERGADDAVDTVLAVTRDVSGVRGAQAALAGSEERFRLLVESVRDYAILMLDADGRIASWNAGAERCFGYPAAQVLGRHHGVLASTDEGAGVAGAWLAAAARDGRLEDEGWRRRADGSRFWANTVLTALRDADGRLVGFANVTRDLSERREAEEALRRSEGRLAGIVGSAMDAILTVGEDERVVVFNAAAERMFGVPAAEALGSSLSRFIPERFRAAHHGHVAAFARTGSTTRAMHPGGRLFGLRADGTEFPVEATISQVHADGTRLLTVIVRDVTERLAAEEALRASEERLQQAQKMEAVGRLAGGIAHDFNNLLMAIGGHTQLVLHAMDPDDPDRWHLDEVKRGADRAASLTQQLLAFSRRQVLQPRVLELNAVVDDLRRMLERLLGEDVELVTRLDPAAGSIRADATQVEQVVMNLAVNARDAMPQGGVIVMETAPVHLSEEDRREHPDVVPGAYVLLSVTDSGHGMAPETVERIWEPFFTTKEPGKGTGLGLSTVYGIVKQSGGYVRVDSTPGMATTFRVLLPRVDDAPAAPAAAPAGAPPGGTETVLLAEDDEAVRRLASLVLRGAGYRVLEAADGRAALDVAAACPDPIHLLVTDVVMPGMGGPELARRLAAARPDTRVLYLSGYSDAVSRHGALGEGAAFVQKPVLPDDLVAHVRERLDAAE